MPKHIVFPMVPNETDVEKRKNGAQSWQIVCSIRVLNNRNDGILHTPDLPFGDSNVGKIFQIANYSHAGVLHFRGGKQSDAAGAKPAGTKIRKIENR